MDAFNALSDAIKERIINPLTGAFAISWPIVNYKMVLIILSGRSVEEKIYYIDSILYPDLNEKLFYMIVIPFFSAIFYTTLYQIPVLGINLFIALTKKYYKILSVKIEEGTPITIKEKNELQEKLRYYQLKNEELQEKYDKKTNSLESSLASRNQRIQEMEKIISEQAITINEKKNVEIRREIIPTYATDEEIKEELINKSWTLYWHNKNGTQMSKEIKFEADGKISIGKNSNENKWRVDDGYLEFISESDSIYNRFIYDEKKGVFYSTNEFGLEAISRGFYGQGLIYN